MPNPVLTRSRPLWIALPTASGSNIAVSHASRPSAAAFAYSNTQDRTLALARSPSGFSVRETAEIFSSRGC